MEVIRGCAECKRLAQAYESETMNWFRLEGHLRIAEYGRDPDAVSRIASELDATTRQRNEVRAAIEKHKHDFHSGGSQTNPLAMRA